MYVLGTPETSLRGRSTRTARNVRRSKLLEDVVPLADMVINLHITSTQCQTTSKTQTNKWTKEQML